MNVSKMQLERVKKQNPKDIALYTKLVAEKKRILEEYGYEEKGEEVAKYEEMLNIAIDVKNKIETGFFKVVN